MEIRLLAPDFGAQAKQLQVALRSFQNAVVTQGWPSSTLLLHLAIFALQNAVRGPRGGARVFCTHLAEVPLRPFALAPLLPIRVDVDRSVSFRLGIFWSACQTLGQSRGLDVVRRRLLIT